MKRRKICLSNDTPPPPPLQEKAPRLLLICKWADDDDDDDDEDDDEELFFWYHSINLKKKKKKRSFYNWMRMSECGFVFVLLKCSINFLALTAMLGPVIPKYLYTSCCIVLENS